MRLTTIQRFPVFWHPAHFLDHQPWTKHQPVLCLFLHWSYFSVTIPKALVFPREISLPTNLHITHALQTILARFGIQLAARHLPLVQLTPFLVPSWQTMLNPSQAFCHLLSPSTVSCPCFSCTAAVSLKLLNPTSRERILSSTGSKIYILILLFLYEAYFGCFVWRCFIRLFITMTEFWFLGNLFL